MKKTHDERPDLDLAIGIYIRSWREGRRITQKRLAQRAQVSQSCISMMETGYRRGATSYLKMLERIALAVGEKKLSKLIEFAENIPTLDKSMTEAPRCFGKKRK
jgi:transcriptional regulator with XRE-family HTH domain